MYVCMYNYVNMYTYIYIYWYWYTWYTLDVHMIIGVYIYIYIHINVREFIYTIYIFALYDRTKQKDAKHLCSSQSRSCSSSSSKWPSQSNSRDALDAWRPKPCNSVGYKDDAVSLELCSNHLTSHMYTYIGIIYADSWLCNHVHIVHMYVCIYIYIHT